VQGHDALARCETDALAQWRRYGMRTALSASDRKARTTIATSGRIA
jgi:hypothetical protein